MMVRRRQMLFTGLLLFFGSTWFMLSQLERTPSGYLQEAEAEVKLLQSKLTLVEKQLAQNKQAMQQVKKSMVDLLNTGNVHDVKQREDLEKLLNEVNENSMKNFDKPVRNVSLTYEDGTCKALTAQVARSDVNMLHVYDTLPFDDPDGGVWKQGYPVMTSNAEWVGRKLKVFVVPHSHNDPGWIKTVDKYFADQTQNILNTVVDTLSQDPKRRFIWAEMSYLSMWWKIATPDRKIKMKQLVENGQLEMVTAGWVMNDEANTHYFAMIDQMVEGNAWLIRTLGTTPRSGWAIDPFGHSSTMAYILKKMNFENMLIQRVHYAIKKHLSLEKSLEFRWRQAWSSDDSTDILCHMMPFYSYDIPHTCGPDPKICCQFDFARLPGRRYNCPWRVPPVAINNQNIAQRSTMLLDQYRKKSKLFKTDTLLVILGDDFRYDSIREALDQYENYGMIFDYVNSHPELNAELKFGTLSEYFDAMKKETGGEKNLPSLTGDFFTYSDRTDNYWSGYYISRPYHKMQERVLESHLRGAEILFSLALPLATSSGKGPSLTSTLYPLLVRARRNLGLFQHHDGITGTAKDHVVVDYGNRLMNSVMESKKVMALSAQILLMKDPSLFSPQDNSFDYDEIYNKHNQPPEANVIRLSAEYPTASVVIYNSLAYVRTGVVRIRVSQPRIVVRSADGEVIASQSNLVWLDALKAKEDDFEILFLATVPATGISTYKITIGEERNQISQIQAANSKGVIGLLSLPRPFHIEAIADIGNDDITLQNELLSVRFSRSRGFMQSITARVTGVTTKVALDFGMYSTRTSKEKSGAYLFLPSGAAQPHVGADYRPLIRVITGPLASEVHVELPNLVHRVIIYSGDGRGAQPLGVHIQNYVDVRSGYDNKEISMRFSTDIASGSEFYTDLNGFQIQKRTTYEKLPLQANFYPMPAMAYIQDKQKRLTFLTGQPLGVSSLGEGQLEVIMDRRLMQDDNRGLGQGVKDNVLTPESFVVLLEHWNEASEKDQSRNTMSYPSLVAHRLSWELLHPTHPMTSFKESSFRSSYAPLEVQPWPCDMHLLNLRAIQATDQNEPTDQAALFLHRVGRECNLDSDKRFDPVCRATVTDRNGALPVTSLFTVRDVCPTSLSLQKDGQTLEPATSLTIKPMEIEAFKIRLT